jgi:hypothetical protein
MSMIRMRCVAIAVGLLCLAHTAFAQTPVAQTGEITGVVRDGAGSPLEHATVQVVDTRLGALTRRDGSFSIRNVPIGKRSLVAKLLGYGAWNGSIEVKAGKAAHVEITLPDSSIALRGVTVEAQGKRREASDTRTSVTKIEPREAKYLPGAAEDIMRSLRSLPGVIAPNDFSAQLIVRGSGPDQNLIVLDDIEVFNPYRLYGFVSMFNPETVSDITLLTGGFPAKYGDRLSAVLDVTNREGAATGVLNGKLNVSLSNANLVFEGKLPDALNGGWLLSGRRTYYDLILGPIARSAKLVDGDVAFPNFRDLQFKAITRPWKNHSFVINALTSRDGTDITSAADRERIDSVSVTDRSYNSLVGLAWRFSPEPNVLTKTIASWYQNRGETQFGGEGGSNLLYGDLSRDSVIRRLNSLPPELLDTLRSHGIDPNNPPALGINDGNASFDFRKYTLRNESSMQLGAHLVEFGAGVDLIRTTVEYSARPDSILLALRRAQGRSTLLDSIASVIDYYRTNAFAQDRIAFGDRFFLQPGVRFDYYKILDRAYVSPRLSASYSIDPITTLRAAFGVYYQSPGYEKLIDGSAFYDLTSPQIADLRAERAMHYVLGIERMVTSEWQVKVEGYYKRFSDLIVQQKLTGTQWTSTPIAGSNPKYPWGWTTPTAIMGDSLTAVPVNDATGAAYGVEFLLQKISSSADSKLNGWIGYTLAWANRYRDGVTFPLSYDQRHTVNVVANYKPTSWLELGANFEFGSGFPYTPPVGFHPLVTTSRDSTGQTTTRIATNVFGEALFTIDRGGVANVNSARIPPYQRLDVRGTFYADWWDLKWAIYLDIINVYNHKNILSRSYSVDHDTVTLTEKDVSMLPILPTIGLSLTF